jgi:hypothetical protein
MPGIFGLWGDSLDHLAHLLVAFILALPNWVASCARGAACQHPHLSPRRDGQLRPGPDRYIGDRG